jgi:hypothetical protein
MALASFTNQRTHDKFVLNSDSETAVRTVTELTSGGNTATINDDGELSVVSGGHISTANSSSTKLDAGIAFTGTAEDITNVSVIIVGVKASHASATDGLSVQFSPDGTNWDGTDYFTVPATSGKTFSFQPALRYFRVVYTNGAVGQTYFRLQTIFKHTNVKPSSHRIADAIIDDDDAELVTSVLKAKANGGGFINIGATSSNNLRVTDAESGLAIAKGDVTGTTFIHKFGAAPDFDVADGFVTVWDAADDSLFAGSPPMLYTYSATADIGLISSSGADTVDIEIQGLDGNYDLVTQTITLNGTTDVDISATGTDLLRVFRMKNVGATDLAGDVYIRTNGSAQTGGVPNTANTIRGRIQNGNNQTLMAIYTIPDGYTGYIRDWYASTAGAKRDSQHTIEVKARPLGQVFQLKHLSNISVTGTSYIQHVYEEPEVFSAKTDVEMRMDTDTDIAGVSAGFDIVLVAD